MTTLFYNHHADIIGSGSIRMFGTAQIPEQLCGVVDSDSNGIFDGE